jgi:hypothetical protein
MLRRLLLGLALLALPAAAEAKGIKLVQGFPDITIYEPIVGYDEGDDLFTVTGIIMSYRSALDSPAQVINGNYTLQAKIDALGVLTPAGSTLSITKPGDPSNPFLIGNLTDFGSTFDFDPDSRRVDAKFEFLFTVGDGSLASDFGGGGAQGGVIVSIARRDTDSPLGFGRDFLIDPGTNFRSEMSFGDTFAVAAVPEPSTITIMAFSLGCLGVGALVRRRMARG